MLGWAAPRRHPHADTHHPRCGRPLDSVQGLSHDRLEPAQAGPPADALVGRSCWLSRARSEAPVARRGGVALPGSEPLTLAAQLLRDLDREVGKDAVRARALEALQALHHGAVVVEPAVLRGGL